MPPTASISSDPSHAGEIISTRPRRVSRINYANLASGKTEEKSMTVKKGRQKDNPFGLMSCMVVLVDLATTKKHQKDFTDPAGNKSTHNKSTISSNIAIERVGNVTKRTKAKTKSDADKQSATAKKHHFISIVDESHGSTIVLDESTKSSVVPRKTRSSANTANKIQPLRGRRRATQTGSTNNDVTEVQTGSERSNRTKTKRRSSSIVPAVESGVSPPKKVSEENVSVGAVEAIAQEKVQLEEQLTLRTAAVTTTKSNAVVSKQTAATKTPYNNPFEVVTVSVKRIAIALPTSALSALKYTVHNETQRASAIQRDSAHVTIRQSYRSGERRSTRSTISIKPEIVISAPVAEDPEPADIEPEPTVDANANKLLPDATKRIIFKKPKQIKVPSLHLVIEEEDETNADVYDFLSSSQTNGTPVKGKPKKRARKPKGETKGVKKASAKPPKKNATARKATNNPFGCNKNHLAKVIRNIGGGPIKSPVTVGYVVNLEIPDSARKPYVRLPHEPIMEEFEDFPSPAASVPFRAVNPAVEQLRNPSSRFGFTSTPMQRSNLVVIPETPPHNPASPWRLPDESVVPRTSYMPRNKEMLPAYESFVVDPNPRASIVTERPHPRSDRTTAETAAATPRTEDVVSEADFREIERIYSELKATSELSKKLITVMRRYKAKLNDEPNSSQQDRRIYQSNMKQACTKLKQWYKRSKISLNHSMRIISSIQQATSGAPSTSPIPLSSNQQRTVDSFNHSTDQFRAMIADLHAAMNDTNEENHPPCRKMFEPQPTTLAVATNALQRTKAADVISLPDRTNRANRNPLMALNFVPLPQHTSPVMSPLATSPAVSVAKDKLPVPGPHIRKKLYYENDSTVATEPPSSAAIDQEPSLPEIGACEEVVWCDETVINGDDIDSLDQQHEKENNSGDACGNSREADDQRDDLFGFADGSFDEHSQVTQVTLPMPLNISTTTLKRRLENVRQLIPQRPIFRQQPKPSAMQTQRNSGPTRFPEKYLRVFTSPTKRPHTLRDFVASTPRVELNQTVAAASSLKATTATLEAPDVSAIESNEAPVCTQHDQTTEVVLFNTPGESSSVNRSALHRTYARVARRRRKNIYLANLGLDDDDEDDVPEPEVLSTDSETENDKQKKKKVQRKARRRVKPAVEETNEFKQFVEEFNSMCEEVNRFEMIVE